MHFSRYVSSTDPQATYIQYAGHTFPQVITVLPNAQRVLKGHRFSIIYLSHMYIMYVYVPDNTEMCTVVQF